VVGRGEPSLREAVDAGTAAGYAIADVTDADATSKAIAAAEAARGPVAILVNNAGTAESRAFGKTDPAMFRAMLDVHLMGAVHTTRVVLPAMIAAGFGRIINVASTAALHGYPYVTAYCAAKHALLGLTRALAAETATRGVTVNAVCPGYTDTDLIRDSVAQVASKTGRAQGDVLAEYTKGTPIGRLIRPQEVAAAIVYLCAPEAAAVTGTALTIAGGEL
jgi:3-hydroxybutyrate dehydrogenase